MKGDTDVTAGPDEYGCPPPSPEPIEALFRNHARSLARLVSKRIIQKRDTEDVVQEAFLRVWERLVAGLGIADLRAYLTRTAVNVSFSRNRQQIWQHEIDDEILLDTADPSDVAADEKCHWGEILTRLDNALRELPPKSRHVFILHYYEELTIAEIAHQVGMSKRSVARYVAMAMDHCIERQIAGGCE